jgi:hypothetical protein
MMDKIQGTKTNYDVPSQKAFKTEFSILLFQGIVEVLLRNPKNSQLLYRPNRSGETPYNIDMNHQKTILGQIFGASKSKLEKYKLY